MLEVLTAPARAVVPKGGAVEWCSSELELQGRRRWALMAHHPSGSLASPMFFHSQ